MMELQKAIENVTYRNSRKFPAEEFEVILGHKEEATPYLYEALDYALQKADALDTKYTLHLYALFFLAEFHDRNSFKRILKLASMPSDTLDDLFGDVITEDLADIMYSTYDGNLELLKEASKNPQNEEYVCMAMLNVMAQLYLDGTLDREEWKNYLHQFLLVKNLETELYTTAVEIICKCHFVEMLPEIYSLFQNDFINRWFLGDYDECVDLMFEYPEKEIQFCRRQVSVFSLKSWAMFEQEEKKEPKKSNAKKEGKHSQLNKPVQSHKIGRNDPCPCGSGKKYKHCCLNKPKEGLDAIESREERNQKLLNYPEVGAEVEKEEGKVYLENYFDTESIEIDQLVYLAFRCFPASVRNPKKISQDAEMKKKKAYLLEAFTKYTEKLQKEGIHTQEEYDKKFMIHYQSSQWIGNLLGILEEDGDKEKYREVLKYYNS